MGPSTPQLFCFPFPFEALPNGTRPEETATFLLEWLLLLLELESVPLALSVSLPLVLVLAFVLIFSVFSLKDQATNPYPPSPNPLSCAPPPYS